MASSLYSYSGPDPLVIAEATRGGNIVWATKLTGNSDWNPLSAFGASDGGIVIAGYVADSSNIDSGFIMKLDRFGNHQWTT